MISVQQTIEIIKNNQPEREAELIDLTNSLNRVLAEEIRAKIPSPPYTNSGMDGFAVFWQDVNSANDENPVRLKIIGESSAGVPFTDKVTTGCAIRISTGAIVPPELDCVIPIEYCRVNEDQLEVHFVKKQNQHIRFQGEEYKKGELLLIPGIKIGSAQIALIAAQGITKIKVYKKARVTILTTGSELIALGKKANLHQLIDSNTPMLSAAVEEASGIVVNCFHVKDDAQLTQKAILEAVKSAGIIISSGGVSMGEHDHVRKTALQSGFKEMFWKVRQKPGKPMFLAKKNKTLLIALPGNPVSAFICFKHYVRPLLQSIAGYEFSWPFIKARLNDDTLNDTDRTFLLRVRIEKSDTDISVARPLSKQGSHMPSSIAHADGYIIIPENSIVNKGEMVSVYLF